MSNSTSSLISGSMNQDTKTILFEIMVFMLFGGGLRGIYKWFKESNFTFIIKTNKGKCSFDCKSSAEAVKPEQPAEIEMNETKDETKV
jgi:hypothetical protein